MLRSLSFGLFLLLTALPVSAQEVYIITSIDSAGMTIVTPDEYRSTIGRSGTLDSILTAFDRLVETLPEPQAREDFRLLPGTGELTLFFDVTDQWRHSARAMTNVTSDEPNCPRIFIHGSFLLDTAMTDCRKRAILDHEWMHSWYIRHGWAPAFFSQQTEVLTAEQAVEMCYFELAGFAQQVHDQANGDCLQADIFGRAFQAGGPSGLCRKIMQLYGWFDQFPGDKDALEKACRWPPLY